MASLSVRLSLETHTSSSGKVINASLNLSVQMIMVKAT